MRLKALKKYKWIENSVRLLIRTTSRISPVLGTKLIYRITMEKKLDLKNPRTLNEKLQYLKLYHYRDNDLITKAVDKYRVREYINSIGGEKLLNELYGVYDSVDEIDIAEFPNSFVLKCNHDSGSIVICENKNDFDWRRCKVKLKNSLKKDYWLDHAEVQYKYVKKKIICEKYLENTKGQIVDYKFYCFHGEPRFLYCSFSKGNKSVYNFYDINFKPIAISRKDHEQDYSLQKPKNWIELTETARKLCQPFPFVRVDLFDCNDKIYFSEFTFCPTAGLAKYNEKEVDEKLGELLTL